jgi:iron complex outermembrane receptor protein
VFNSQVTGAKPLQVQLVTANATSKLGLGTSLDSSAWHQSFSQKIDSYTGADYETIEQRQVDRDRTWGLRELLTHRDNAVTFVGSMNFLHSTHYQWDIEYADGRAPIAAPQPLIYSQRNWSLGGEVEYAFSSNLVGEVGVGYDRVDYLRTGDKPPVRHAAGWTGRLGAVFDAGSGWRVRAALGHKIRAATMRELFGQSLKRFLINPDLLPERIVTAEVGIEWRGESGEISLTPFLQDVNQTIDQRRIGLLRQRINLEGSTVHGMEFVGNWQLWSALKISGSATWTRVRRKDSELGEINRIAEKPALLAGVRAEYADGSGFTASIEAEHIGRAWSANDEGTLVPLKRSTALNGRLSYLLELPRRGGTEIFLRVDNVTDILVEPQLGLPAPGRTVRVGIKFK